MNPTTDTGGERVKICNKTRLVYDTSATVLPSDTRAGGRSPFRWTTCTETVYIMHLSRLHRSKPPAFTFPGVLSMHPVVLTYITPETSHADCCYFFTFVLRKATQGAR